MKGNILIEGVLMFADLFTPGGAAGYAPKFSATIGVKKGPEGQPTPSELSLFSAMEEIARKTWPSEWEAKLAAVHRDIMEGTPPADSKVSLQDGDIYQPDYNAGFWVVKPSRRTNQGPPEVFEEITDPSTPRRVHSASDQNAPMPGWGVIALVNVWAMAKQSRINFTLLGLRGVQVGVRAGGPPPAAVAAAMEGFLQAPATRQIAGVVAPSAEIPAQASGASPGVGLENAAGATIPGSAVPSARPAAVPSAAPQGGSPLPQGGPSMPSSVPQGPPAATIGLGGDEEPEQEAPAGGRVINL